MAKQTGYIIVETNFDYNDEYYSQQDGGKPVKVYMDQELAKKEVILLELKALRQKYFRYSDYVSENGGHSEDSDEKFLDAYFKIINAQRVKKVGIPATVTAAMTTVDSEVHVKWTGKKGNGDVKILAKEIDSVKKMLDTASTYSLSIKGRSCDIFFIQHAIAVVAEHEAKAEKQTINERHDIYEARDMVKFENLTDEQLISLTPLMPISFYDVSPIEIDV